MCGASRASRRDRCLRRRASRGWRSDRGTPGLRSALARESSESDCLASALGGRLRRHSADSMPQHPVARAYALGVYGYLLKMKMKLKLKGLALVWGHLCRDL